MTETPPIKTAIPNDAADQWRQGDVLFDAGLINQALQTSLSMADTSGKPIQAFIVSSQTCDILKKQIVNVQLCAVVKCQDSQTLESIKKRRQVRYAYIPSLANDLLVADLAIVMPLSKATLAKVDRHDGGFDHDCISEDEAIWITRFQGALSRLVSRFAFPDNFNPFKMALKEQLDKLKKAPATNKGIYAIDEILATVIIDSSSKQVTGATLWLLLESKHLLEDHEFSALNEALSNALKKVQEDLGVLIKNGANSNIKFPIRFRFREPADTTVEEYKSMNEIDFDDVS